MSQQYSAMLFPVLVPAPMNRTLAVLSTNLRWRSVRGKVKCFMPRILTSSSKKILWRFCGGRPVKARIL